MLWIHCLVDISHFDKWWVACMRDDKKSKVPYSAVMKSLKIYPEPHADVDHQQKLSASKG